MDTACWTSFARAVSDIVAFSHPLKLALYGSQLGTLLLRWHDFRMRQPQPKNWFQPRKVCLRFLAQQCHPAHSVKREIIGCNVFRCIFMRALVTCAVLKLDGDPIQGGISY